MIKETKTAFWIYDKDLGESQLKQAIKVSKGNVDLGYVYQIGGRWSFKSMLSSDLNGFLHFSRKDAVEALLKWQTSPGEFAIAEEPEVEEVEEDTEFKIPEIEIRPYDTKLYPDEFTVELDEMINRMIEFESQTIDSHI